MKHTLHTNQILRSDETLTAADGSCYLIMQRDGNLCMYTGRPGEGGGCFWAALTSSQPIGDYYAVMQGDGNLCVYQGTDREHRGHFIWGSGPHLATGGEAFVAKVTTNNLSIWTDQSGSRQKRVWEALATRHALRTNDILRSDEILTAADGSSYLIMQRDGNLCMYTGQPGEGGGCFWAALTSSLPTGDYYAIMQGDGNFCVYHGTDREHRGRYVWGSGDHPHAGSAEFIAQVDANNLTVSTNQPGVDQKMVWAARPILETDQILRSDEHLVAPDGSCYLIMQRDGNLCLYTGKPGARGGCFWAALNTSQPDDDYYAIMQGDGNLCVYQGKDREHRGRFVWGSGDHHTGSRDFLAEVKTNNLTVATNQPNSRPKLLWEALHKGVPTGNILQTEVA